MNNFKIIVTSYNNENWTETCLESLLTQTYKNFNVLFFDDGSSDSTFEIAKSIVNADTRFNLIQLKENHTKSYIFANFIDKYIKDTDIVLFLDGDDWLATSKVLDNINQFYEFNNPWVAYGGMVVWNGGEDIVQPFPQNSIYPQQVILQRLFRLDIWRSSHAKTMRGFIWKSLNKSDFISVQDNKYILGPDDLVIMFNSLERCLPDKVGRFDFNTYVYNHSPENISRIAEHQTRRNINYEMEIRSRPKLDILPIITSELSGGVGNQMFQIAATVSLAKRLNYVAMFDLNTHFLPLQGRNIKTYRDNLFKNIIFTNNLPIKNEYTQPDFNYAEISNIPPFTILKGGYQTEKYFDKDLVLDLFSPSDDIKKLLLEKYGDTSNVTSIHVRRGDFLKLYPHHIFVGEEYYTKSINEINSDKYFIFSDDISWCKSFFKGNQFRFIEDEDYNELYLMSLCKNNIIGNSTFSWWGAWLNQTPNKKVITPNMWFGPGYSHWNLSDLIPKDWMKI